MLAFELLDPATEGLDAPLTSAVASAAGQSGTTTVTCGTYCHVVRLLPYPLIASHDLPIEGLGVITDALAEA